MEVTNVLVCNKTGFFDKFNNGLIVDALKQLFDRRDCEIPGGA